MCSSRFPKADALGYLDDAAPQLLRHLFQPPDDRLRRLLPSQRRPHPCSGAQATLSRFPTVLVDVTHELPEVLRIGIGPRKPRVVRVGTVSRHYPTNTQRITVS